MAFFLHLLCFLVGLRSRSGVEGKQGPPWQTIGLSQPQRRLVTSHMKVNTNHSELLCLVLIHAVQRTLGGNRVDGATHQSLVACREDGVQVLFSFGIEMGSSKKIWHVGVCLWPQIGELLCIGFLRTL